MLAREQVDGRRDADLFGAVWEIAAAAFDVTISIVAATIVAAVVILRGNGKQSAADGTLRDDELRCYHRLMNARFAAISLVAFVGCAHGTSTLPWPKSAGSTPVTDWHDDGGESLAPHASSVPTEIEDSVAEHDEAPAVAVTVAPVIAPMVVAPKAETPTVVPPVITLPDEEIVIEVVE